MNIVQFGSTFMTHSASFHQSSFIGHSGVLGILKLMPTKLNVEPITFILSTISKYKISPWIDEFKKFSLIGRRIFLPKDTHLVSLN